MSHELEQKGQGARRASRCLAVLDTGTKNKALQAIAEAIVSRRDQILEENARDLEAGTQAGLGEALLDRLRLSEQGLRNIARDLLSIVALPDPVGETFDSRTLPNGLQVGKRRVPIGVIGVIYESRPNVTVDISALCLKSGNAAILRGGKEAARSNQALAAAVSTACQESGLPAQAVQLIESTDRTLVREMLTCSQHIDMIIPRGGAALHKFALENATIPVITGGIGICHAYVDRSADAAKAISIVHNAKVKKPSVCNALDTLLIHKEVAQGLLPRIAEKLLVDGVTLRCEPRAQTILNARPGITAAGPKDFDTEFLSLNLAVKVVDSFEEAVDHIFQHSTHHSDVIITEDYSQAMRFVNEVDSAAVYVNASTYFTDGGQFGLGAEVAISTQRLHARGPMGLKELTTYKWIVFGDGHIRE
ncbi:MAG: glutamate-5-semialdehyde dehydrogenase [Acidobacteriota bacterium]